MKTVNLVAAGAHVPERILTNADLEKMVDTSDAWIRERTGISERRIAGDGVESHDLAALAAQDCLSRVGRIPDLLIASTCTPGRFCPYQSSIIANRLKLDRLAAFDINAACSGLVYGLGLARSMMLAAPGTFRNVLVTAGEKMSKVTDYSDRNSCILFGDGAAALFISSELDGHEIVDVEMGIDPSGSDLVSMGGGDGDYYFRQDGKQVFRFAVTVMGQLIDRLLAKCGLGPQDSFYIIPHQANLRMIQAAAEQKRIPFERFVCNIEKYGNTSSASIGLAMTEAWREGRFRKGDHLLLIAFGGGLSWAGAAIRW